MSKVLSWFLLGIIFIQFFLIFIRIKKKGLSMKYGSLWIVLLFLMFIAVLFPNIFVFFSKLFGFEKTSNMIFLFGFFFLFYMIFMLTISLSKQKSQIVLLTQEISLLKKEKNKKAKED